MKKYTKLYEYENELLTYKGRRIVDIEHSENHFKKRFPQYSMADWKKTVAKGIDVILDTFKDKPSKYIIISKSKQIGIQVEWRKDKKNDDGKYHGFTATTLDHKTQKDVMQGDVKIFVESIKKYRLEKWFDAKDYLKMIEEIGYIEIRIPDCPDYKIYVKEGKIKKNFKVIEVE